MSDQTTLDDELAFERRLLGAGLAEALPHERTEAALLRFAAGVAALQSGAIGARALSAPSAGALVKPWARLVTSSKWLGLGVIAGSLATFAWLRPAAPPPAKTAKAATAVAQTAPPPSGTAAPVQQAKPLEPPLAASPVASASPKAKPSRQPAAPSGSDLAAEVAALDGIRTAMSIGALRDAELKLANYRRDFTRGALRKEAEVLALEVLLAQGREQAAASAAERFVLQHPRDPQVARVRALVE